MMRYEQAVLEALKGAACPLRQRDLVDMLSDGKFNAFNNIGAALQKLYRAGRIARTKPGNWFAYTYIDKPVIQSGYAWSDGHGPITVMAVADGYAMVRRPGCLPSVMRVRDIEEAQP